MSLHSTIAEETAGLPLYRNPAFDKDLNLSIKFILLPPEWPEHLRREDEIAVALSNFADAVQKIIETFEAHCLGQKLKP